MRTGREDQLLAGSVSAGGEISGTCPWMGAGALLKKDSGHTRLKYWVKPRQTAFSHQATEHHESPEKGKLYGRFLKLSWP